MLNALGWLVVFLAEDRVLLRYWLLATAAPLQRWIMKNAVGRLSNETSASMSHDQLQDTLVSTQSLWVTRFVP